jgi:hypothetical protein
LFVLKKNFDVLNLIMNKNFKISRKLEDAEASFQDSLLEIDPVRIKLMSNKLLM